jgi:cysteine-rich repeat protein
MMRRTNWNRLALSACLGLLAACGSETESDDPVCGNGSVETGEQCDDGNLLPGDGCSPLCFVETGGATCGNGTVDAGEACDDGNTVDGDGCAADCTLEPTDGVCGDGTLDAGEACDDGNTADGDGCSANCAIEEPGAEICDNGVDDDGDGAADCADADCANDPACPAGECGDGELNAGEACDDGDANSDSDADACRTDCSLASCGDGVVDTGEACDGGDNCLDDCTLAGTIDCGAEADLIFFATDGVPSGNGVQWTGSTADWADDSSLVSGCSAAGGTGGDAVFVYEATQTGFTLFNAADAANTADVSLLVYESDCNAADALACGEDSLAGDAQLLVPTFAGRTYFVRAEVRVNGDLTLSANPSQPPSLEGDACNSAQLCDEGLACVGGTCAAIAGTCASQLVASTALTGDWATGFTGTLEVTGLPSNLEGSCGGAGREVAVRLDNPSNAQIEVTATSPSGDVTAYLRSACTSEATEQACAANGGTLSALLRGGRPATLVLDATDPFASEISVTINVLPTVGLGGTCGAGVAGCAEFLVCTDAGICRPEPASEGQICDPVDGAGACEAGLSCIAQDSGTVCRATDAVTCAAPVDLNALATADGLAFDVSLPLSGAPAGAYTPSCAPAAATLGVWVPDGDGLLEITGAASAGGTLQSLSVRSDCAERPSELVCDLLDGAETALLLDVTAGVPVYVLAGGSGTAALRFQELTERLEGQSCDDTVLTQRCAPGLICGPTNVCEVDVAFSCAEPLEVDGSSASLLTELRVPVDLRGAATRLEGTCGGADGREAVVTIVPQQDGVLNVEWTTNVGEPVLYARDVCTDGDSQTECSEQVPGEAFAELALTVTAATPVTFVLDATSADALGGEMILRLRRFAEEGDTCEDTRFCQLGLGCIDNVCVAGALGIGEECDPRTPVGQCSAGLECNDAGDTLGLCFAPRALGALCDSRSLCREGLSCSRGTTDLTGTCVVPAELGEACLGGDCVAGAGCDLDGFCAPLGDGSEDAFCDPMASNCGTGLGCASIAYARPGGTCTTARGEDGDCLNDAMCGDGFWCRGVTEDEFGVCTPPGIETAERCDRTEQCVAGAVCAGNEVSGVQGVCNDFPARRGPCSPDRLDSCAPGSECVGEVGAASCEAL